MANVVLSMETIDLRMTWGEWGNMYARMAECGETKAAKELRRDLARAMAAAEALKKLKLEGTLTNVQVMLINEVFEQELQKAGYQGSMG